MNPRYYEHDNMTPNDPHDNMNPNEPKNDPKSEKYNDPKMNPNEPKMNPNEPKNIHHLKTKEYICSYCGNSYSTNSQYAKT